MDGWIDRFACTSIARVGKTTSVFFDADHTEHDTTVAELP
jgi:hypothetical protein